MLHPYNNVLCYGADALKGKDIMREYQDRMKAFPKPWEGHNHPGSDGMDLRDWFAGMAISGAPNGNIKDTAEWAYQLADQMMAERNKDK